jgi:hypothetical protein
MVLLMTFTLGGIMFLTIAMVFFSIFSYAQTNCEELYINREQGLSTATDALKCFEQDLATLINKEQKAHAFNRMSYLKFFIAEYHLAEKEETLLEAINLAEKSLLLFGTKYAVTEYMNLSAVEKKLLAEALYNYGLTTARYIDIKGQWEAIKRMEDIKRSMNTIIRIKEEATAFYGAHRTLGIFHTKVPVIAGGKIELAKQYMQTVLENTPFSGDISRYPANNLAYADLMFKLENKKEYCHHLNLVAALTETEVRAMDNGLFFETMQSVKDAKKLVTSRKCSI